MTAGVKIRVLVGSGVVLACLALTAWLGVRATEAVGPRITILDRTTTSIKIQWSRAGTHGSKVEWRQSGTSGSWQQARLYVTTTRTRTISGLRASTEYEIRVNRRLYDDGDSTYVDGPWSDIYLESTDNLPARVTGLSSTAEGDNSVTLSWTEPDSVTTISDYDVQYRAATSLTWTDWPDAISSTSVEITGLTINLAYEFQVRAVNSTGNGSWSATFLEYTFQVPAKVSGVSSDAQTGSTITLRWWAPASDGAITDYDVSYREVGLAAWTEYPNAIATTTVEVAGLNSGRNQEFRVRAVNRVGAGEWSATFRQATKSVPTQVQGFVLTSANATQLSVRWFTPSTPRQYPIIQYHIEYRVSGDATSTWSRETAGEASNALTIGATTALQSGTSYELRARAVNSEGEGLWSSLLFAETEFAPIDLPTPDPFGSEGALPPDADGILPIREFSTVMGETMGIEPERMASWTVLLWFIFSAAVAVGVMGMIAASNGGDFINPWSMGSGMLVMALMWGFAGPVWAGVPWPMALTPLALMVVSGILLARTRGIIP